MVSAQAVAAVELLCALAAKAPADLPDWHYDQVDDALLGGLVPMAAAWPGATGPIRRSALADRLAPAPYLAGPARQVSYAGCHAWAVPTTCGDVPAAVALVERLCSREVGDADAASGSVPAHVEAFASVEPEDDVDARRLAITRDTIADGMITYPPLARFPEVEDAGWSAINAALRAERTPQAAVAAMQAAAEEALQP
jgi:multiple sugar transport system substrate-binding protein